jgi:hypothetical protein
MSLYRRFHDRFGTAGVVLGVIALIAALGGTALAAGGLTGQQEKQVKKIAKKYAGKRGPAGPQGPAGANGAQGEKGAKGDPGIAGPAGKSVVTTALLPGEGGCVEGGTEFEVEGSGSPEVVCNGEEGPQGAQGEPWTAGGTLPPGATETGVFRTQGFSPPAVASFNIPLSAPLDYEHVAVVTGTGQELFYVEEEGELNLEGERAPLNCHGTPAGPQADAGYFCLYMSVGPNPTSILDPAAKVPGAAVSGTLVGGPSPEFGTWAVTQATS